MNNWYKRVRKEIELQYGDDADLFCDLLAATSPRKQVGANWKLAARVYKAWRVLGISDMTRHNMSLLGVMSSQQPNVIRALNREPLSGPKVRAFAANLKGDFSQVTVDIWMLRLFNYDKPTEKRRKEVVDYVIRAAAELGYEPAEVQAEMWEHSVRRAGREPKSYLAAAVKQRQMNLFGEV
jgi:hypothetical protein